ncbi:MAG: serine/threonine-protein kinase [Gemmatimonadota bacterium]|nr:serine/threonine-protein kinase [Gemmatimonadota bacterium]
MNDPDLHRRAIELLDELLDLGPDQRLIRLEHACDGDPELRELVESLLVADGVEHALLDSGAPEIGAGEPVGAGEDRVGPYRLIREVGRGGMATVYLAERTLGDVRQRVALKLLKRGIDTDEVLRRFAQESRVLAALEHPHIARFYDARAHEGGTPYLAMEFVEGRPLTAHCDERQLSIADRLALFRTVCEAVQHAHRHLVVHRDLKPSNILVDDSGQVKLLDFGIAKLLTEDSDPAAARTRTGIRVLTPEYAAPEQLLGGPVTVATDVYALGLVLHELLTGVRPALAPIGDPTVGLRPGPEPDRPSSVIRRTSREDDAATVAAARATTPDRLRRTLLGDLDTIAVKACAAEPSRRYRSADELGDDVEHYLEGRPILARPATVTYRMRKFARRHRAGVLVSGTAAVLAVGFTAFYSVSVARERDIAEAEAARAQITTEFLQRLLGEAYPSVALGDTFSMADLLRRAVARVDSIEAEPDVQAELLRTIGDVYREQGRFEEALPLLERAVALHRRGGQIRGRAGGRSLDALGHLEYERGDYGAALATHEESLQVFGSLYEPDDSLVLFALNNVATAATALGDFERALELHRRVLDRHTRLFADTSELVHVSRNNLGHLYHRMGDYGRAEGELAAAVELRRRALPANHPSLALSLNNLGATLRSLGRLDESANAQREALEIFRSVFGPDHPRVGLGAYNLALVLRDSGRFDEAEALFRTTLSIDRATYGEDHVEVGADLRSLGLLLEQKGDCETAVTTLAEADAIFAANGLPLGDRRRLTARARIGACLTVLDRFPEAEEVLTAGLDAVLAAPGEADGTGARETAERLAELYRAWGRAEAADSVLALSIPAFP